jgi:hypothetical protein
VTRNFSTAAITAVIAAVFLSAPLLSSACGAPAKREPHIEVVWRPLGAWSGTGNTQTESFTSDTGSLRMQWTTANETTPGAGRFRLTIHSAISGRPLKEAVDHQGPGKDTAYVYEDPRVFFAVVDAANLEWSFTLDEAVLVDTERP